MAYHHGKVAPKRWPIRDTLATLGLLSTALLSSCLSLPDGAPLSEVRAFTVPPESIKGHQRNPLALDDPARRPRILPRPTQTA